MLQRQQQAKIKLNAYQEFCIKHLHKKLNLIQGFSGIPGYNRDDNYKGGAYPKYLESTQEHETSNTFAPRKISEVHIQRMRPTTESDQYGHQDYDLTRIISSHEGKDEAAQLKSNNSSKVRFNGVRTIDNRARKDHEDNQESASQVLYLRQMTSDYTVREDGAKGARISSAGILKKNGHGTQ